MNEDMAARKPLVSIGVPVYNGENYLATALDSILAQTCQDFEIVITDNASTDSTPEICEQYAQRDERVRYFRNDTNIGSTRNFNRSCHLARGQYFKWLAHDDFCAPNFLERCIDVLEREADVVLCFTRTAIVDGAGDVVEHHIGSMQTGDRAPHRRFHDLLVDYMCYEIFGVIRTDALRKTQLIGVYAHGEGVLLARLGLMGRFHEVPEYLSFNRDHAAKSRNLYSNYRDYTVWLDPSNAGRILLPRWKMGWEYFKCIQLVELSGYERVMCYLQMLHWVKTFWKSLVANILIAAWHIVRLPFRKSGVLREPLRAPGDSQPIDMLENRAGK
jgi:glycosyltransferase involved in cell wall biosynthesis